MGPRRLKTSCPSANGFTSWLSEGKNRRTAAIPALIQYLLISLLPCHGCNYWSVHKYADTGDQGLLVEAAYENSIYEDHIERSSVV